jgi:hypothetical protein
MTQGLGCFAKSRGEPEFSMRGYESKLISCPFDQSKTLPKAGERALVRCYTKFAKSYSGGRHMNKLLSAKEAQQLAERYVGMLHKSQQRIRRRRWISLAAVAWCVVFGGFHLYWALGGNVGFAEFSMPSNRIYALTRDPLYIAITWGVVLLCMFAAIAALIPVQPWSRRMPKWLLLSPLWMASGLFLVRGIGNPIQTALIMGGVMHFEPLAGPEAQAWYQWLHLDLMFFSPWFIMGGFIFGAMARSTRRIRDDVIGRDMGGQRSGKQVSWGNSFGEPCCC